MARKTVTLQVDPYFFRAFDNRRREMQKKMGLKNLPNTKFSRMVGMKGDIIVPKFTSNRVVGGKKRKVK